jgi:hypothetical protein
MASITANDQQGIMQSKKQINQWVSRISNFDAGSNDNLNYLNSILGPLKSNQEKYLRLDNEIIENIQDLAESAESSGQVTQQIIFKIDEKVYYKFNR